MKARFTQEQLQRLAKWEYHLMTAYKCGYTRGVPLEALADMKREYDAVTKPHSDAILRETCPVCIYNFVREVGEIYYNSKECGEEAATTNEKAPNA